MAMQRASQPVQAPVPEPEDAEMESGTEEELEKLESDVKHMAENILQYRSTLPDQLKNAFALLASAHRPESPWEEHGSQLGPSGTSSRGTTHLVSVSRVSPWLLHLQNLGLTPCIC